MLNRKTFEENKEEILKKGYRFRMDLKGMSTQEFAMVVLSLVNNQSSNSDSGVFNVKTVAGSNIIYVYTTVKEFERYLRQFTDEKIFMDEIEVIEISESWLELDGFVKDSTECGVKVIAD